MSKITYEISKVDMGGSRGISLVLHKQTDDMKNLEIDSLLPIKNIGLGVYNTEQDWIDEVKERMGRLGVNLVVNI